MFNWLPLRVPIDPRTTFADVLTRCGALQGAIEPHKVYPHAALVDALGARYEPGSRGGFQALYNYVNAGAMLAAARPTLPIAEYPLRIRAQTFDLPYYLLLTENGDQLRLHIAFSPRFYDAAAAERRFVEARALFTSVLQRPEAVLADIPSWSHG
jgi:hypothetical protein